MIGPGHSSGYYLSKRKEFFFSLKGINFENSSQPISILPSYIEKATKILENIPKLIGMALIRDMTFIRSYDSKNTF